MLLSLNSFWRATTVLPFLLAASASYFWTGCEVGASSEPADTPSATSPRFERDGIIPLDGQFLMPVQLDGSTETYNFVIDTGAFATSVEETLVRDIENGVGLVSMDFGEGLLLEDHRVFAADLSKAVDYIGTPIHGLIGQDIFQEWFFGLDYETASMEVLPEIPLDAPSGFEEDSFVDLPYTLEQLLPIVEVEIDGRVARLIADTGSGVTLLTESFIEQEFLDEGLKGYTWHTSYGSDPGTILRLPQLTLAGHLVENSWAVVVPDNYHLRDVFEALGIHVDGFLGYPVYRRFYTEVRGPENQYRFYPYDDLPHVDANEWDRVGIEIRRHEGQVVIDMIFEPSHAHELGLQAETVLLRVDGEQLAGLALDDVRLLLRGTPGKTRTLTIDDSSGGIKEISVRVDGLLPPI